mgnify:FL=1
MKITLDKLNIIQSDGKFKGSASVLVEDCIKITGIKIIDGKNGLFLSMPKYTSKDGTKRDIVYPINSETRKIFNDVILTEYEKQPK